MVSQALSWRCVMSKLKVQTASLYTALWETLMSVSGRKIKVARCRLIRSSASPASADPAQAGAAQRFLGQRRLQRRARALSEQAAQVGVAALGDVAQPGFAARAVLARDQPLPGGQLPPVLKVARIGDGGQHRRGGKCAHAA